MQVGEAMLGALGAAPGWPSARSSMKQLSEMMTSPPCSPAR